MNTVKIPSEQEIESQTKMLIGGILFNAYRLGMPQPRITNSVGDDTMLRLTWEIGTAYEVIIRFSFINDNVNVIKSVGFYTKNTISDPISVFDADAAIKVIDSVRYYTGWKQ